MLTDRERKHLIDFRKKIIETCNNCLGNGWVAGRECLCFHLYTLEAKKAYAEIPMEYRGFTIDMIDQPESFGSKTLVETYIKNLRERHENGDGLLLWSENTGSAKTTLACIVLMNALEQGFSAHYTTLAKCLDMIYAGWYDEMIKVQFQKQILDTDFLLIDDLGGMEIATNSSDAKVSALTTLFKERSQAMLPTIITTNLSPDQLQKDFKARTFSTILQRLEIIHCPGPDFRREVIAKTKENK